MPLQRSPSAPQPGAGSSPTATSHRTATGICKIHRRDRVGGLLHDYQPGCDPYLTPHRTPVRFRSTGGAHGELGVLGAATRVSTTVPAASSHVMRSIPTIIIRAELVPLREWGGRPIHTCPRTGPPLSAWCPSAPGCGLWRRGRGLGRGRSWETASGGEQHARQHRRVAVGFDARRSTNHTSPACPRAPRTSAAPGKTAKHEGTRGVREPGPRPVISGFQAAGS